MDREIDRQPLRADDRMPRCHGAYGVVQRGCSLEMAIRIHSIGDIESLDSRPALRPKVVFAADVASQS